MLRWLVVAIVALSIGAFAFTKLVAPPKQLDLLNSLTPGDGGVSRVAGGVVFDPETGLKNVLSCLLEGQNLELAVAAAE